MRVLRNEDVRESETASVQAEAAEYLVRALEDALGQLEHAVCGDAHAIQAARACISVLNRAAELAESAALPDDTVLEFGSVRPITFVELKDRLRACSVISGDRGSRSSVSGPGDTP